jgi:hypothetical protein
MEVMQFLLSVAVSPETETVLSGSCTAIGFFRSKRGNLRDLYVGCLMAILGI